MKRNQLLLLFLIPLIVISCNIRKYTIKSQAKVSDIERSIHTQFYQALQQLNLENGITIVPQNLVVKLEHTIANTGSAGFTALIVSSNYTYQNIKDNSVSDILAPTKLSTSGVHELLKKDTLNVPCAFSDQISNNNDAVNQSIKALKEYIKSAAEEFVKTPNLGLLNDHQVSIDIKFSFSNQGDISVTPGFALFDIAKLTGKLSKTIQSSDDITFTFDVVQNDENYFLSNEKYYQMRKTMIDSKGGICKYFTKEEYGDNNHSKFLFTPPVADQHDYSACVAYAIGYTCLSTILNTKKTFDQTNEYSPDFLYAMLTDLHKCQGLDVPTALKEVVDRGDCLVSDLPLYEKPLTCSTYVESARAEIRKLIPKAQLIRDKIKNGWLPLDPNNIDQIRLSLDNDEPVIAAFYVSNSFLNMWDFGDSKYPGKNVWTTMSGPYTDAHCICIIGYDNATKLFKCQNSWGKKNSAKLVEGEAGFFWVTYDLVQRGCFKEAYCFLPQIK